MTSKSMNQCPGARRPATVPDCDDLAMLAMRSQASGADDLAEVLFGVAALERVGELGRLLPVLRAGGWVRHGMELAAAAPSRLRVRRGDHDCEAEDESKPTISGG
ncbi:MAG TPA: hypothetical protein VG406_00685 [Isosphaeraceae bacterium]|jgi:hypothetical protein|nr:hypothetical protein [Isosphaeraceae bacterium]